MFDYENPACFTHPIKFSLNVRRRMVTSEENVRGPENSPPEYFKRTLIANISYSSLEIKGIKSERQTPIPP